MAATMQDSFDMPALGRQMNSKKETMPAFSFGTGSRDVARDKLYVSPRHEKGKVSFISPGPVYAQRSTVGSSAAHGFGTEQQRMHGKAKYPDSSVDLTCCTVDSQKVKFPSTSGVHFGTEVKMCKKNAEMYRVNPTAGFGTESPGMKMKPPITDMTPRGFQERIRQEKLERGEFQVSKGTPAYSIGPTSGPAGAGKTDRINLNQASTPRHVGPGSHRTPCALGEQPTSARTTVPAWSFCQGPRQMNEQQEEGPIYDASPELSSMGKQLVSSARSAPSCSFGSSTRDHKAKTAMLQLEADKGPSAFMPKPRFHFDLPKFGKPPVKAGM